MSDPLVPRTRWRYMLTPTLLTGFVLITVVLIGTLVVGLDNLRRVYETGEVVVHTYAVKDGLDELLAAMVDAETGERGFIITGEETFLEPYDRGRAATAAKIARVRDLTVDNREQQADLERMAAAVERRWEELEEAIRQRRESSFATGQAVVATNVGKRTMDGMR